MPSQNPPLRSLSQDETTQAPWAMVGSLVGVGWIHAAGHQPAPTRGSVAARHPLAYLCRLTFAQTWPGRPHVASDPLWRACSRLASTTCSKCQREGEALPFEFFGAPLTQAHVLIFSFFQRRTGQSIVVTRPTMRRTICGENLNCISQLFSLRNQSQNCTDKMAVVPLLWRFLGHPLAAHKAGGVGCHAQGLPPLQVSQH